MEEITGPWLRALHLIARPYILHLCSRVVGFMAFGANVAVVVVLFIVLGNAIVPNKVKFS